MTFLIVLLLLCGQAFCATRYSLTTRPDPITVTPSVSGCPGNRIIAEVVCSLVRDFPQLTSIKSAVVCPAIGSDITTTFYGITYHNDDPCQGIKSIDLSALNLQGSIPTELGKADTMTSLNFGNNKLQGTIPTELSNLKNLEVLSLFFTGVGGTIPNELKDLPFSILDLSANQLEGTIPSPLKIGATLDLSGNSLTGPLPKVVGNITEVFLNNNKLSIVDSNGFGVVQTLKFYDISFNAFTGPIPDALLMPDWLPELQSAYLQSNYFESLPLGPMSVNLTQLDCSYNYLSGALELNWLCSPTKAGTSGNCLDRFAFFQGNRLNITAAFKMSGVSILRLYLKPQDVDDCSGGTHECESDCINGWAPALGYTCSCPNGKYLLKDGLSCDTCFGEWELSNFYLQNYELFPSLAKLGHPISKFDESGFLSCSSCNSGLRYRNRTVAFSDDCVKQGPMFQSQPCAFACSNLKETSATGVLLSLKTELDKDDFLKSIMKELFNVDISIEKDSKRAASTLAFDMSPCQANQANDIQNFLSGLFSDIVPNAPPISFTVPTTSSSNCTIEVSSQDASSPLVAIIVGTAVAALVLALIIGIIAYKLATRSLLHHLPHVVAESYLYYERNPFAWEFKGSKVNGYYFREVPKATDEYSKVKDELLTQLLSLDARLEVEKLVAVYNPTLVSNFIGTYLIQSDRVQRNSHIFFNQKWKTEDNSELRNWVWGCYESIVRRCSWNSSAENISVAIIPAVHGTTLPIASAICETGFASVSSLDSGWYGKGIYFTSYCPYTITYIYGKNQPALVLSWILPGNVYPVTEHHKGPQSLLGTALKNGYNSHFVQSTASGVVPPKPISGLYNEIVVSQESQIAPAYIIHLAKVSKSSFSRFMAERGKELTEEELQQAADDLDRKRFKSSSKTPKFLKPSKSVNSYVSLDEQSLLEEKKRKKFGSLSQSGTVSIDLDADSQSYNH